MANNKAIPEGYMTVGELAKKVGTTVRTLQYYDREGLLEPSAESAGGRRLYTGRDAVKLHQILSLKYLGFSLDDIKNRLSSLDTPQEVAAALADHAAAIHEKIAKLSEELKVVEALKKEVLQMHSVDFGKYADIIVNLQMKNEMYWAVKLFDDATLDYLRGRFDKESGPAFLGTFRRVYDTALRYQQEKVAPESEKGQALAKEFWSMVMEFTGGDMSLMPKLLEFASSTADMNEEWMKKQEKVNQFIEPALSAYFTALGCDPFEEGEK